MKHEFSRQISKNTQISNFIQIRPVRAELFHADRLTRLTVVFAVVRMRLKMITRFSCTPLSKPPRGFTIKVKVNWFFNMPWMHIGQKEHSPTYSEARTWMKMIGQLQAPAAVYRRKNPGNHWIADWVGPSTSMNGLAPPGLEHRTAQPVA
jgi:hypothetical protein